MITEVFLFDAPALVEQFRVQKRRLGVAAYVRQHEWEAARVYPEAAPRTRLPLTDAKREALKLFAETKLSGSSHSHQKRPGIASVPLGAPPPELTAAQPPCQAAARLLHCAPALRVDTLSPLRLRGWFMGLGQD